ncbi:MAG: MFS transporter [Planctomycetota bacterium]
MPTLTGSRRARTAALCALYCAQGMPWGFVTITLLSYLGDRGVGLEQAAEITALATLPWSFKVVWGVLIDRFTFRAMGRRRPWVLLAQLAMGVTLLSMILIDDLSSDVQLLAWMVFVHNCFVSLQDVSSDALAVEVLADDERGRVNGMMWASAFLGEAIGGAGMGTVLAHFGVQAAFVVQVSVLLAIACFPLFLLERSGERLLPWSKGEAQLGEEEQSTAGVLALARALLRAFRSPAAIVGVLFAMANNVAIGMLVTSNPVFFTQELGWSQERYSQLAGGAGAGAGVLGALLGGFLVDRLGVRILVSLAGVLIAGLCFGMGASEELRLTSGFAVTFFLGATFLISAQTVSGFSLFMRLSVAAVAGTQFTLFMAASNFARVFAAKLVGTLGENGYAAIYFAMGGSMLLSLPLLLVIPQAARRR